MQHPLRAAFALICLVLLSCAPPPPLPPSPPPQETQMVAVAGRDADERAPADGSGADAGDPGPIPATSADPQWGRRDAPVTIVYFSDFQCPFCSRIEATFAELRRTYGPAQLRIVWKNNPLPFHKDARPSAEAAMAMFERGGNDAFWTAHGILFADQRNLLDAADRALAQAGLGSQEVIAALNRGGPSAKVDADMALGKSIGVTGTPASFINGVFLSGAQPIEKFTAIIDAELAKAKLAMRDGVPASRVYVHLTTQERAAAGQRVAAKPPSSPAPAPDDKTVHRVPVGTSPVLGKATALVTIVEFADYQCPFCGRVEATLKQIVSAYGDKVRIVWKDNPLPFHPRAEPAAELAREARAQKGDATFWKLHDALFASQPNLDDTTLAGLAAQNGINATTAMKAVAAHKFRAILDEDTDLADDVEASGTPHFFINGRRLVGAQPFEKFRDMIDEELVKAEALVKGGTPAAKVYEKILSSAAPMAPMPTKSVPAPTAASPSRGPANAKVVVQFFSDFECPFCKRVIDTLAALEKEFPGKIRIVWRNRPLPMHPHAEISAEAAMEAFKQKGSAGFWAMHDALYAAQGKSPDALDRPALEVYATEQGLDMARFRAALDASAHKAAIDADIKIAEAADISGTPAFVINGYFVSGAQPLAKFRKIVKTILAQR